MESQSLLYPEAALWDLITRDATNDAVRTKLNAIMESETSETELFVATTIASWLKSGLVETTRV